MDEDEEEDDGEDDKGFFGVPGDGDEDDKPKVGLRAPIMSPCCTWRG